MLLPIDHFLVNLFSDSEIPLQRQNMLLEFFYDISNVPNVSSAVSKLSTPLFQLCSLFCNTEMEISQFQEHFTSLLINGTLDNSLFPDNNNVASQSLLENSQNLSQLYSEDSTSLGMEAFPPVDLNNTTSTPNLPPQITQDTPVTATVVVPDSQKDISQSQEVSITSLNLTPSSKTLKRSENKKSDTNKSESNKSESNTSENAQTKENHPSLDGLRIISIFLSSFCCF